MSANPNPLADRIMGALRLMSMPETTLLHSLGCGRQYLRRELGRLRRAGEIHSQLRNRVAYYHLGPERTTPANEDDRDYAVQRIKTENGTIRVQFGKRYRIRPAQTIHPRERGFSSLEMI